MRWPIIASVLLILSQPALGQTPPAPAAKAARFDALVAAAVKEHDVTGLSVAVVINKELVWTKGFGKADLENNVPTTEKTVYRLASVSKPITAVMAMALVEQGKLDLDAPVQKYVPEFPVKDHPINVRHLLCHQSGIRHYSKNRIPVRTELESTQHFTTLKEGLRFFQDDPLQFAPGEKFSYSTHAYTLLGCVIEGAGGRPYLQQLSEVIAKPAGAASLRDDDVRALIPHRAQGYHRVEGGQLENSTLLDNSYKIPGGGLCCNAPDLAKFAIALMSDKILSAKTRDQMWTVQKPNDGSDTKMALGWTVGTYQGRRIVMHGGAQQRVTTMLDMEPDAGIAIVLLCNLERQNLRQLAEKISAAIHE